MEVNAAITGYRAIDVTANKWLPHLRREDQARLRRELKQDADRFRTQGERLGDRHNLLHRLREIIVGGFLAKKGYPVQYARKYTLRVDGRDELKTPDWTICGPESEALSIVEVANFHGDVQFEETIRGTSTIPGLCPVPTTEAVIRRLYAALEGKCLAYRTLVKSLGVPYVVAVGLEFVVSGEITPDDVCTLLHDPNPDYGLFLRFPELSGVIHFADADGYRMRYSPNPQAHRPLLMPQGW
jgi:hypothetical protein